MNKSGRDGNKEITYATPLNFRKVMSVQYINLDILPICIMKSRCSFNIDVVIPWLYLREISITQALAVLSAPARNTIHLM